MTERSRFHGMRTFLTVWVGQICSLIGSGLTDFALGLWVYRTTGSITLFAFISMFAVIPQVVLSPVAGAFADRWNRRTTMIFSNVGAAVITLSVSLLYAADRLSIGYIYFAVIAISTCSTFLRPAFGSSTVLLVPKEQLGRANGLVQTGLSTVQIISPLLAGFMISVIDIQGILFMDTLSYVLAIGALLLVRFPPYQPTKDTSKKDSLWSNILFGWKYLAARPGLLGLLGFMAAVNVVLGISTVLLTPLVLSMATPLVLGTILSTAGIGMIAGGLLLTVWGGPQRRINGVLGFMLLNALFLALTGLRPSPILVGIATFGAFFCQPLFSGMINVILQSKVEPGVQGRVFGTIIMVALSTQPIAFFLAGPLSDFAFNPLLTAEGPLANSLGQLLGVGPERGIGLFFVVLGLLGALIVLVAYLSPRLRLIDDELPDIGMPSSPPEPQPAAETPMRVSGESNI